MYKRSVGLHRAGECTKSVRPEQSIGVYKGSVGVHRAWKCTNGLHKAHYSEQCNTKPGEKITRKMHLTVSLYLAFCP